MARRGLRLAKPGTSTYLVSSLSHGGCTLMVRETSAEAAARRGLKSLRVERVAILSGPEVHYPYRALAFELTKDGAVHLYARRDGDGWMLTDWAHAQEESSSART